MSITNTNAVAKVAAVVAGLGLVAMSFASFAVPAKAATADDLAAQIAALQAQLAALSGGSSASATFTRDLTIGSTGADVTALQTWLMGKGFSIPAGATGYFGAQTQSALAAYQASVGIMPAAGYFGPITRAKVGGSVSMPDGDDDSNGDLEGGAGSVDSYELMASLNNEEVGEDEEDAEVAGLEIEADDGSDLEITAVRLVFDEGTAASDFEDYAEEVSIWFDGEEVGRTDADEFNDDNDWTKTVSLDDAILEAGETGELVVAITGASNLDSDDLTDTWTVDFRQIRFEDADGATVSEDPSTGTRTFSFESFASSADVELKISEDDDAINDARTIVIDATDDTDDVEVLSFTAEAEGDSDLTIDSFVVSVVSTEATGNDPDDLISALHLIVDGDEIASETMSTADGDNSQETVVFDDLEWVIEAGETAEVVITADLLSVADTLDEGDTLTFNLTENETDSANFDVEDETGEELADGDKTGSASSGAFELRAVGIDAEFVSASETVIDNDAAGDNDSGTFKIKFNVTAIGDDVYVSKGAVATTATDITAATIATNGILYLVTDSGTATTDDDLSDEVDPTGGDYDETTNNINIDEDDTAEIELTVVQQNDTAEDDGLYRMSIEAIGWNTDDSTTYNVYDFELEDFETGAVTLN